MSATDITELTKHIAPLLSGAENGNPEARRFDMLVVQTQLAHLSGKATAIATASERISRIATGLQKKGSIAAVAAQMPLIDTLAKAGFLSSATVVSLEPVRTSLRGLVRYLDKEVRPIIYTNFVDEISGPEQLYEHLTGYASSEAYRDRMEQIVRQNENHLTIRKLRNNQPITSAELAELERMLIAGADIKSKDQLTQALGREPLGWFVWSIMGLDSTAAKAALSEFIDNGPMNTSQIEFMNTLVNYLCENGIVEPKVLYSTTFTDIDSGGVDSIFGERSGQLFQLIARINGNAQAFA